MSLTEGFGVSRAKPFSCTVAPQGTWFCLALCCAIHPLWDTQLGLQVTAAVFKCCLGFIQMSRYALKVPLQKVHRSCHLCRNNLLSKPYPWRQLTALSLLLFQCFHGAFELIPLIQSLLYPLQALLSLIFQFIWDPVALWGLTAVNTSCILNYWF